MTTPLQPLLQKAFKTVSARDANTEIGAQREAHGMPGQDALSYEVVLEEAGGLEVAAEKVLPKLVYFLDCRGVPLHDARGVFMSVFVRESLYFVHATDFVAVVAPLTGFSLPELKAKYGAAST